MAYLKTTVSSATFITPIESTPTPTIVYATGGGRAVVQDGRLVYPNQVTFPSVFTAGTPQEGTLSNPNNDSSI